MSLASALGGLVLEFLFGGSDASDLDAARARLRRWITTCLVVLLLATCAELLVRTQAMSGAPWTTSLASVPSVMMGTHLGQILTARLAAVVVALLLSFEHGRTFRAVVLLATLAIALSLSLTGHAADWGDVTLAVGVDWAHAVAASAWVGGLIALALVAGRRGTTWSRESLATVASRFSRLAGLSLLAVVVTGGYNAWAQLGAFSRLWTTNYGRVLLVKLLLVAVLMWLGAINRYALLPRLAPEAAAHGIGARAFRLSRLAAFGPSRGAPSARVQARLVAYITVEALLGLAVFACTALLGELTPGRHAKFERRPTHAAPRSGTGGPPASTVTPPRGDAERGRTVFARLECGTCHAVPDQSSSPPTRPGPDLAGIGARYPGEIVESIMNPNAKILDGPGYTDDRGLSTMPDYSDRLTVGELSDLVEYLRGFEGTGSPGGVGSPSGTASPPGAAPATDQPAPARSTEPR